MKREKVMRLLAPIAHKAMFGEFEELRGDGQGNIVIKLTKTEYENIAHTYMRLWRKSGNKAIQKREVSG